MNLIKNKIKIMQIISIIFLMISYTIASFGLLDMLIPRMGISFTPIYISIIISIFGVSMAFIINILNKESLKIRLIIILVTLLMLPLIIVVSYLVGGSALLITILSNLLILLFLFVLSFIPLIGTYSLIKNQKNTYNASAIGVLFIFFFIRFLTGSFIFSDKQIELLLLFFIFFICYFEIGAASNNFNISLKKMLRDEKQNQLLPLLNNVINRYILLISTFLFTSYLVTILILWNTGGIASLTHGEYLGIDLSNAYGVLLLVIFIVACSFILWLLIPREKPKKI